MSSGRKVQPANGARPEGLPPSPADIHRLPTANSRLPFFARVNLLMLAAIVVALIVVLWPYWRDSPDLSHGFLMPVVFLLLLRESRAGNQRYLDRRPSTTASLGLLLILGILALCASGLYAAALAWTHPLVAFTLSFSLVLFLGAGLVVFASDGIRLVPFNWTSCSAIALWMLCAPIPPGSYTRLTLGLQLVVTSGAG